MPNPMNIPLQRSCCLCWCWAAVTSMIVQGCNLVGKPRTQPEVFRVFLGDDAPDCSGCCSDGCTNADCNLTPAIRDVLFWLKLSDGNARSMNSLRYSDICEEIDAQRPVVAEIAYTDAPGAGHVLLIYGYQSPDSLTAADPANGQCIVMSFAAYANRDTYQTPGAVHHGVWINSYFLKQNG